MFGQIGAYYDCWEQLCFDRTVMLLSSTIVSSLRGNAKSMRLSKSTIFVIV